MNHPGQRTQIGLSTPQALKILAHLSAPPRRQPTRADLTPAMATADPVLPAQTRKDPMPTPTPELINSIVEVRRRQDPDLALDSAAAFEAAQKTAQTLADQGFTRVDNIVNLPGKVTVYEQGRQGDPDYRSSRLTLDNAVDIAQAGINSANSAPASQTQRTEAPTVTVFPPGVDATAAPTPVTPPAAETPQRPSNDLRFVDNGFQWGDVSGKLSNVEPTNSVSGQAAQNARLNLGEDVRIDNQFRGSPLSPDRLTAGTTIDFSPSARLNIDAGQNFVANGATVDLRFDNPQSSARNNAFANAVFGQNGTVANIGGAVNVGEGTLSGRFGIDQPKDTISGTVGYASNDARDATPTTQAIPSSTSGRVSVTDTANGTTVAVDGRIPVNNGEGTVTANVVASPTATKVGVNYQSNDSNNARDPNLYVPPSTQLGVNYDNDRQAGNTTVGINAQLPVNGDRLGVAASNTSGNTNQTNVAVDYTQGNNNYRANVALGDSNQVGVGATINNGNTAFNGDVKLDLDTNRVTGAASIATGDVNNGGRFTASAQVNDQGQVSALASYQLGDNTRPAPLTDAQARQRVDDGVLDYRIAQLTGNDKKLYEQALAGVNALNERGENIQNPRETALSLAAAADKRGMDIAVVELGTPLADGRQNIIIANGPLQGAGTDRIGVDRQEAANTNGFSSLQRLTENTPPQQQSRDVPAMAVENANIEGQVRRGP